MAFFSFTLGVIFFGIKITKGSIQTLPKLEGVNILGVWSP